MQNLEFYFFFFYSNSEGCWFESSHSKTIKLCLHKYEIFPPLFSSKGLCTCPTNVTIVKSTILRKEDYRLCRSVQYIVILWLRLSNLAVKEQNSSVTTKTLLSLLKSKKITTIFYILKWSTIL